MPAQRDSTRTLAAAVALLIVLGGLGWWGYAELKKRELQAALLALVSDATARVNEVLHPLDGSARGRERLDAHFRALQASSGRLAGLDLWRKAALASAAQRYLDEAHALLRRRIAEQRSAQAVRAAASALTAHVNRPRGRAPGWISHAVALKQALEREFFDWRIASGGLGKSLQTLGEARARLAPLVAPLPLVEDRVLAEARQRHAAEVAELERLVESARKLPEPR